MVLRASAIVVRGAEDLEPGSLAWSEELLEMLEETTDLLVVRSICDNRASQ